MDLNNLTKEDIINRIGYFRNKKNISAYKLGLELGHSKTYFYRIESGEIALTLDLFLETLEVLGVTTTEFFSPYTNEEISLINKYKELSPENKQMINSLISKLN